jgi:hypothetical protein
VSSDRSAQERRPAGRAPPTRRGRRPPRPLRVRVPTTGHEAPEKAAAGNGVFVVLTRIIPLVAVVRRDIRPSHAHHGRRKGAIYWLSRTFDTAGEFPPAADQREPGQDGVARGPVIRGRGRHGRIRQQYRKCGRTHNRQNSFPRPELLRSSPMLALNQLVHKLKLHVPPTDRVACDVRRRPVGGCPPELLRWSLSRSPVEALKRRWDTGEVPMPRATGQRRGRP